MTTATETKPAFETETCGRCGGSGRYSYCQMYGDRCFKCGGKGKHLTKRGLAAATYLKTLRSKPACEVKVGDEYLSEGFAPLGIETKWVKVETIEIRNDGSILLRSSHCEYGANKTTILRIRQNAETVASTFAAAMEYQNNLTKAGKPKVRKSKEQQ